MGLNTSVFRSVDLDETAEAAKTSRGEVFGWSIFNDSAGSLFVHFYDVALASVTVGTTVPKLTIGVGPADNTTVEWTNPIEFGTAITVAATTAPTGADAPGTGECIIDIMYR